MSTFHEQQVRQFLDFHRRRGGDWESAFWAWSASKAFGDADRHQLRRMAEVELFARGVLTTLDGAA